MIYDNIKRLCETHGISIAALEKKCGIANGTIGKWRGNNQSPRICTLQRVADHFGVPVDELLKEAPHEHRTDQAI